MPIAFQLRLLDAPRIEWDDGRTHALERKDAALLAMLALDGPLPRARAAALLWPDAADGQARGNLRQRLFRLRRLAGRDLVEATDTLRLAPDIDLISEVGKVYGYFAMRHGARIMSEIGFDPTQNAYDPANVRAQLGLEDDVQSLSHRELRERRAVLQKRVEDAGGLPVVDEE